MSWIVALPALGPVQKALPLPLQDLVDTEMPVLLAEVGVVLAAVGIALSRGEIAAIVSRGDALALEQLLLQAWEAVGVRGFEETIIPRLRTLALQAAEAISIVGVDVAFNVRDPEALAAIDAYAARQITAINQTTIEAIQGIIRRAFESGTPITQQISEIAELVGLTPRQAESLARFRQGLLDAGETPRRVQEAVARRAAVVRQLRAEGIARTESLNAAHIGQAERLNQAARDGVLDAARVTRFWVLGSRPCPAICVPIPGMNPQGVGLNEPFKTPVGARMYPTAHPQCMCVVNIAII